MRNDNFKYVLADNKRRVEEMNDRAAELRALIAPYQNELDILTRDREHLIKLNTAIRNKMALEKKMKRDYVNVEALEAHRKK